VVSVSIWYYKAAMLTWALWLSFALVRWVRWAWAAFSAPELWRRYQLFQGATSRVEPPGEGGAEA
jgi:hypothetical protein